MQSYLDHSMSLRPSTNRGLLNWALQSNLINEYLHSLNGFGNNNNSISFSQWARSTPWHFPGPSSKWLEQSEKCKKARLAKKQDRTEKK